MLRRKLRFGSAVRKFSAGIFSRLDCSSRSIILRLPACQSVLIFPSFWKRLMSYNPGNGWVRLGSVATTMSEFLLRADSYFSFKKFKTGFEIRGVSQVQMKIALRLVCCAIEEAAENRPPRGPGSSDWSRTISTSPEFVFSDRLGSC